MRFFEHTLFGNFFQFFGTADQPEYGVLWLISSQISKRPKGRWILALSGSPASRHHGSAWVWRSLILACFFSQPRFEEILKRPKGRWILAPSGSPASRVRGSAHPWGSLILACLFFQQSFTEKWKRPKGRWILALSGTASWWAKKSAHP